MIRTISLYALGLAVAALLMGWLEYRYALRMISTELYVTALAVGFAILGLWAGYKLTYRPPTASGCNEAAIRSLGLTSRECEILELLATGQSNKEIARTLGISPNTVKTHLAAAYGKLGVSGRVAAIENARRLAIINPT